MCKLCVYIHYVCACVCVCVCTLCVCVCVQQTFMRHHWVHRRRQEGKCKQCGKVRLVDILTIAIMIMIMKTMTTVAVLIEVL